MKFYHLFILLGFILLFESCKCEGTFVTYTRVINSSTTDVVIKGYRDGVIATDIATVRNGDVTKVGQASGRSRGVVFSPNFYVSDSVVVEFGGKKKPVYYGRKPGNSFNAIMLSSPRSLFMEANYVKKALIDEKCYIETEFVYTFCEEDYLNAN